MKLGLGALALGVWVAAQAAVPVITNITMVAGTPQFRIQSDLGITNQIQYSTNLGQTNWTVLTNVVVTNSPYVFVDTAAPPASYRLYRVAALYQTNKPVPSSMALIPAGNFMMGNSTDPGEGYPEELPPHRVYLSAFYMDTNLVSSTLWTNVCQWATNHGYSFDTAGEGKGPDYPAHGMTWYDAVKWCNARSEQEGRTPAYYTSAGLTAVYRSGQTDVQTNWVKWSSGYRLPTEAEWEKAARGGLGGQRFPWGNTISESQANYYGKTGDYSYDLGPNGYNATFAIDDEPYTSPVGSFAANGYGLYDMAGNVWQWCWDYWDGGAYSARTQTDPRGPAAGSGHAVRGGRWGADAFACRAANRYTVGSSMAPNGYLGFHSVLPPGQ